MPDITMCYGNKCPKKETCYRYTAKPNTHWQSYFKDAPIDKKGNCNHYWNNKQKKQWKQQLTNKNKLKD